MDKRVARPKRKLGKPTAEDITSGMATGLFSIPEGMAYASIAGQRGPTCPGPGTRRSCRRACSPSRRRS
ncbi:hypothetical protein ACQP1O_06370 [Nocardia sp. CA-151230]|uniref:hypothetical protein n=1 Tax=Nocardia sp. CA-151230 TaxID=3239982 RepID=UPI003D8FB994